MAVLEVADDGTTVNTFAANDYTPDTSAVLAGDLMVVTVQAAYTGAAGTTEPAGWTSLHYADGSGSDNEAWWKVAAGDAPTETWTFASAAQFVGTLTVVRGEFNAGTPITDLVVTTDNSLGTVTYGANDLVLGITLGLRLTFAAADTTAIPTGFTEVRKQRPATLFAYGFCTTVTKLEAGGAGDTSGLSFTYAAGGNDVFTMAILVEYDPGAVPTIVTPPVVTGTPAVGETLTSSDGTWTNVPTSFSYLWERSANGTTGWATVGANQNTIALDVGDGDYFFRCTVTATNGNGDSDPSTSNVVGPIISYPTIVRFSLIG